MVTLNVHPTKKNEQGLNHLKHDFLSSTSISYIELYQRDQSNEKNKKD